MTSKNKKETLREWLKAAPFSLSLSAGFFGFYAHAGFVSVLEEESLYPNLVTGSSAGALVGGVWSSGTPMAELQRTLFSLERRDFWDPCLGWGLLKGERFDQILNDLLHCNSLEQSHIRLTLATFELATRKTRYFSNGPLSKVIRASCAFPGLFVPVEIEGRAYLDGGILDRSSLGAWDKQSRTLFHHLPSRSKLRYPDKLPADRAHLVKTIITPDLPKLSPFKLSQGRQAFEKARTHLQAMLNTPV